MHCFNFKVWYRSLKTGSDNFPGCVDNLYTTVRRYKTSSVFKSQYIFWKQGPRLYYSNKKELLNTLRLLFDRLTPKPSTFKRREPSSWSWDLLLQIDEVKVLTVVFFSLLFNTVHLYLLWVKQVKRWTLSRSFVRLEETFRFGIIRLCINDYTWSQNKHIPLLDQGFNDGQEVRNRITNINPEM